MTYDSIPIYNYSGKLTVEPISVKGQPAVRFSGLNAVSSCDIVSVSGMNLVTSPKSTGSMNVIQSTTPVVIYGNVGVLNMNHPQGLINTMGDFNQLLQRVDATSMEGKEEVRNLVTEFNSGIATNSLKESRSILRRMEDKLEAYPQLQGLVFPIGMRLIDLFLSTAK